MYPENLRWTTGGEYHAFSKLVMRFLTALETLHCRPYFVFDGELLTVCKNVMNRVDLTSVCSSRSHTSIETRDSDAALRRPTP